MRTTTSAYQISQTAGNISPLDSSGDWQIIRKGLLAQVDIKLHSELYRLCEEGEIVDDLLRLTSDQILLRWFNYHLKTADWKRR